jgi:hypothetical protein
MSLTTNLVCVAQMDNVLIDDRRVHVDFSQSVSKLRQQYGVYDTGFFGDRYRYTAPTD